LVIDLDDLLLHKSEGQLASEDLLMFLEETSGNPLVNGHSNDVSEIKHSNLIILIQFSLFNSLEEESGEGLKRVLIHLINDAKLDEQEIEHSSLGGNSSVDFSQQINLDFSFLGNDLLFLDGHSCFLCGL
jgi:hypothetical protein